MRGFVAKWPLLGLGTEAAGEREALLRAILHFLEAKDDIR